MKARIAIPVLLALLTLLTLGAALRDNAPAQAASVSNYRTYNVEAGATRYYAERTTTAINVDGYGTAIVGVGIDAHSLTTTFAITAQYAIPTSGLCTAAGLTWYDGEDVFDYASLSGTTIGQFTTTLTTTLATTTYRTAFTQLMEMTGDANEGREFRILGRCMRLVITPSSGYTQTFTPTVAILAQDANQ